MAETHARSGASASAWMPSADQPGQQLHGWGCEPAHGERQHQHHNAMRTCAHHDYLVPLRVRITTAPARAPIPKRVVASMPLSIWMLSTVLAGSCRSSEGST